MLREGGDIRTVQAVMRHSAASTTLNTYAHEIEGAQAAAVAHVDRYLQLPTAATSEAPGHRLATAGTRGRKKARRYRNSLEERVGFEPTDGSAPSAVFKTAALTRSAISPSRSRACAAGLPYRCPLGMKS